MVDKVKPLKLESSATGGVENDFGPTEANPTEDYLSGKGFSFEHSDSYLIYKDAQNELGWIDGVTTSFQKFRTVTNFYANYNYAEDLTQTTTSDLNWQTKLTLTSNSLIAGDYHITWSYAYAVSSSSKTVEFRVIVDDTTVIQNIDPQQVGANQFFDNAGFGKLTLTSGVHTVKLQYRRVAANPTIKSARLALWRVS